MRYLVTGGAGFIGHHVVQHLLRHDHAVVTLDRLDTSGTLCRLAEVCDDLTLTQRKRLTPVWHDLRAPIGQHVDARIGAVDVVLHLAAATHVDRSIEDPLSFVLDNVVGTANLLEWARGKPRVINLPSLAEHMRLARVGVARIVIFSTDEVHGPAPEGVAYKETDRQHSGNPYAATKAGAEQLALAYHNTYRTPVMITRTMNVVGERQSPEKFLPGTIVKLMRHEKVLIHANADKTKAGERVYIDVRDVVSALMHVVEHGKLGEIYNVVGPRTVDNLELANMISAATGQALDYELVDFHSARPGHDLRYALDGAKLARLGWSAPNSIEETVHRVVTWTLENRRWLS